MKMVKKMKLKIFSYWDTKERKDKYKPYVAFKENKIEFLNDFGKTKKETLNKEKNTGWYSLEKIGTGTFFSSEERDFYSPKGIEITLKEQKEFNLKVFGKQAKTLDQLLNLLSVNRTEYKIPDMYYLIKKELKELEQKILFKRKEEQKTKQKKEEETKEEGQLIWLKDLTISKIEKPLFTATKNFIYRDLLCVKTGGKKKVRTLCHIKKSEKNSHEVLNYYYDKIKELLTLLFDFEENMFGIDKGVKDAVADLMGTELAIKIDLKNFFNNTRKDQIRKGFKECCKYEIDDYVIDQIIATSTIFGRCYQGQKLATILCYIAILPVIKELNRVDQNKKAIYIDDVFISLKEKNFEKAKEELEKYKQIFKKHGFIVNEEKSKVLFGNKVFFLGVNLKTEKLGYNSYTRFLKSALFNYNKEKKDFFESKPTKQEVLGKLNYLKHINFEHYEKLKKHNKYGKIINKLEGGEVVGVDN